MKSESVRLIQEQELERSRQARGDYAQLVPDLMFEPKIDNLRSGLVGLLGRVTSCVQNTKSPDRRTFGVKVVLKSLTSQT